MKNTTKVMMVAVVAFGAGMLFSFSLAARPAAAEDQPARLHTLLERLRDGEGAVTVEFARPLVSGESTWTLPDEKSKRRISEVGEDFICFSEPWNDGLRNRCTPFGNIVDVTFIK